MTEPPAARPGNNFDALRLAGALLVLVGHGFVLNGYGASVPVVLGFGLHPLGLALFFSISGYLIMGSWLRHSRVRHYLTNRAARILPALLVSTVLTAFVLGPVATALSFDQYFASGATWTYLVNAFPIVPQYNLPGVFESLPYPVAVNGSLWTLRVEFACYAGVLAIGYFARVPRIALLVATGLVTAWISQMGLVVLDSNLSASASVATYFIVGAVLRHLPAKWLDARIALPLVVVWGIVAIIVPVHLVEPLSFLVMPYVVISIGLASTPVVRRAGRFGDLSYGIYLWAFPVQQSILLFAPNLPLIASIALCGLISALLALASWHAVEGRALRGKDRLPWMTR